MTAISLDKSSRATEVSGYIQQATAWDASRVDMLERSQRRAWTVASVATLCVVLAVGAIVVMMPLKQTEPYVIRVDGNGVPTIVTAMRDQVVTTDSVMNKYWLAKYITHRETYNRHTLEIDYNTVGMLSDSAVGARYAEQFKGDNAKHEQLGDKVVTSVLVHSVVLNNDSVGTVRFRTTTTRVSTNQVLDVAQWVATMSFVYMNTAPMDESVRLVNPFGFRVTSYRLDPEHSGGEL